MFSVLLNRKVTFRNPDNATEGFLQNYGPPKVGTVVAVYSHEKRLYLAVAFDGAPLISYEACYFILQPIDGQWQSPPSAPATSSPTSTGPSPSAPK